MITKIMAYCKGYVIIHATGYFLERFLNICTREDILIWDIERSGNQMRAKVSIKAFCHLRRAARKTRTKIRIKERYGLPFLLRRNRKRRGIIAGVLIFAVIICYFSTHLMGITVSGSKTVPREKIIESLNSYGVKIGTPLKDINSKILKNQLMTAIDSLGWAGVSVKGSRLYIEVRPREEREDALSSAEPCNIVAAKDGIIRLMEVRDGQTMVYVDTLVEKGDLLVSGVIDSDVVGMRYTHSYGEIYATTWYEESMDIPLSYTQKVMTGEKKSKYEIGTMGGFIKLYLSQQPGYKICKYRESTSEYSLPLEIFPSLSVRKHEYLEQKELKQTRTKEEAENLGKFYLFNKITRQLSPNAEIVNISVKTKKKGNYLTVTAKYECLENIAEQVPIDKTEIMGYNNDNSADTNTNEQEQTR